jgi:hypothetical protein
VTVTAPEALFDRNIDEEIVSSGGLVLRSFYRSSATSGLALLVSTAATEVGRHELVLEMGGGQGTLAVSVLAPQVGPGTVQATGGDVASSGAELVRLSVVGQGTRFDSRVTAEIEDAEGISVQFLEVLTATSLEVRYSVSLSQEPTTATMVLRDGNDEWRLPITIVAPKRLASEAGPVFLPKGQAGYVRVENASSVMAGLSRVVVPEGEEAEYALPVVHKKGVLDIPVRVPFDTEGDRLFFEVWSFDQGAFLEIVEVEVTLLQPTYLAAMPSRLPALSGDYELTLVAPGFDFKTLLAVEARTNDAAMVTRFAVDAQGVAKATLSLAPGVTEGMFKLVATGSEQELMGVVAIAGPTSSEHLTTWSVEAGDRLYLPVAFSTDVDFVRDELTAEAEEGSDLTIHSVAVIDENCAVLEVEADKDGEGWQNLWLEMGGNRRHLSLEVVRDLL